MLQGLHLLVNPLGHGLERGAEAVDVISPLGLYRLGGARLRTIATFSHSTLLEGVHRRREFPEPAGQEIKEQQPSPHGK